MGLSELLIGLALEKLEYLWGYLLHEAIKNLDMVINILICIWTFDSVTGTFYEVCLRKVLEIYEVTNWYIYRGIRSVDEVIRIFDGVARAFDGASEVLICLSVWHFERAN